MKLPIKIDIDNMDTQYGSIFRAVMDAVLGPNNISYYKTVYLSSEFSMFGIPARLHNAEGPAAIKCNGELEYWIDGEKLSCTTDKEFQSYLKNKAFW